MVENNEEIIQRVENAAREGAKKGSKEGKISEKIIPFLVLGVILVAGIGYIRYSINKSWTDFANNIQEQSGFDNSAESHDLVLDNEGVFGYTAADFAEAILGETKQVKKMEVYEAKISDVATLTDTGFANIKFFTKTQVITYNGTAIYTVDLSELNENSLEYDETNKIVTLYIPHAVRENINIPSEEIQFDDPERGLLAIGKMSVTPEDMAKVESEAKSKMETKLDELKENENADRFAKLSVWETYQPFITKVSPEVQLEVEFRD